MSRIMRQLSTLVLVLTGTLLAGAARAQCADPATHFRGGLWKQWILQLQPGPVAQDAIARVIAEINVARASGSAPQLIFDPTEVLALSVIEESNPRGPDGNLLADRTLNRELFIATFAPDEAGGYQAVFLTDPLRSNADLAAKGVPGQPATFERSIKSTVGPTPSTATKWLASNAAGDQIRFSAEYPDSAITFRSRTPGATSYLTCNLATTLDVVYRSLPLATFALFDRTQAAALLDLTAPGVDVRLKVRHHDDEIQRMFSDPANQQLFLFELERVVRFERK
jgi:hypothetical protein